MLHTQGRDAVLRHNRPDKKIYKTNIMYLPKKKCHNHLHELSYIHTCTNRHNVQILVCPARFTTFPLPICPNISMSC